MRHAALLLALALGGPAAAAAPCVEGQRNPVVMLCFAAPETRYGHGVLGATPEWTMLEGSTVDHPDSRAWITGFVTWELLPDRIFEDIRPRLADLDGDGQVEVLAVESRIGHGARLHVFGFAFALRPDGAPGPAMELVTRGTTPWIGRQNRWRAPAAIADFDGDGRPEIAEVVTPHLAGVLRLWRLGAEGLEEVAEPFPGVSNHRIGGEEIVAAVRPCSPARLVIPDLGWTGLLELSLIDGRWQAVSVPGPATAKGAATVAATPCQ